jgi:hypothetical protein
MKGVYTPPKWKNIYTVKVAIIKITTPGVYAQMLAASAKNNFYI